MHMMIHDQKTSLHYITLYSVIKEPTLYQGTPLQAIIISFQQWYKILAAVNLKMTVKLKQL